MIGHGSVACKAQIVLARRGNRLKAADMARFRSFFTARQWLVATLLMVALLPRILVPQGYMPVITSDGITVTLCTGHGAVEAKLSFGQRAPDAQHNHAQPACPFAGIAPDASGQHHPKIAPIAPFIAAVARSRPHHSPGVSVALAAPPPPAQAPPLSIA